MFHPETAYEFAKERQRKLEEEAREASRAPAWMLAWRKKAAPLGASLAARISR